MKKFISLFLSLVMAFSVFACVSFNAYASQSITVKFEQSEARTVLDKINALRTGSDAWYWNQDNTTKTYVTNAKALAYDYTLEKIAMQRVCELYFLYEHQRPDGSNVFTTYEQYGYASLGKGENIAYGYPSLTADEVHEGWSESGKYYAGQGHRRIMLDSRYTAVGIAHISYYDASKRCDVHYWVEEFGTTVSDTTVIPANDSNATVTLGDDKKVSISGLAPSTVTTTAPTPGSSTTQPTSATTTTTTVATTESTTSATTQPATVPATTAPVVTTTQPATVATTQTTTAATTTVVVPTTAQTVVTTTQKPTTTKAPEKISKKQKKANIKKATPAKASATISWSKVKGVKGYEVQLATDKKFKKNVKSKTINKQKTTKTTVKNLKSKTKYYVRIRTYKMSKGTKVYSTWSKAKTVKTK